MTSCAADWTRATGVECATSRDTSATLDVACFSWVVMEVVLGDDLSSGELCRALHCKPSQLYPVRAWRAVRNCGRQAGLRKVSGHTVVNRLQAHAGFRAACSVS